MNWQGRRGGTNIQTTAYAVSLMWPVTICDLGFHTLGPGQNRGLDERRESRMTVELGTGQSPRMQGRFNICCLPQSLILLGKQKASI